MSRVSLTKLTAVCLIASLPALAQNAGQQQPASQSSSHQSMSGNQNIRAQLMDNLKQAGFTDVKVAPDSFLVRAKDKSGNPVAMFIDSNSVFEITDVQPTGNRDQARGETGKFASVPTHDELTSKAVGVDVYNASNQDIGKIKDVAIENNAVKAYILGVGGFLGVGERYIAVNPSALKLTWDGNDNKWRAEFDATKQELQSAPEYEYPSSM